MECKIIAFYKIPVIIKNTKEDQVLAWFFGSLKI